MNEVELLGLEDQVLRKEIFKINLVIRERLESEDKKHWSFVDQLHKIVKSDQFFSNHIDFVFKVMKAVYSALKSDRSCDPAELKALEALLVNEVLPYVLKKNDESYCKVLEWTLKNIYRIGKYAKKIENSEGLLPMLDEMRTKFSVNPNLISIRIKIRALLLDCSNVNEVKELCNEFRTLAYADQKEIVRVANVKSVAQVVIRLDIKGILSTNPESIYGLILAIVLILNDEHPEIRSYMLQQRGI